MNGLSEFKNGLLGLGSRLGRGLGLGLILVVGIFIGALVIGGEVCIGSEIMGSGWGPTQNGLSMLVIDMGEGGWVGGVAMRWAVSRYILYWVVCGKKYGEESTGRCIK